MKKSTLAKLLLCIMFPLFFTLGGCVYSGGDYTDEDIQDLLDNIQQDPDYYKKYTYTFYDSNGKQLKSSIFDEVYVFVDPGEDGVYFDHKTGEYVGFADLASRELDTLSKDIAYKLLSVYGDNSVSETQEIKENIKDVNTGSIKNSQYKIINNKSDSLGIFEDVDKNFYNTNYANGVYRLDDMYTLSLLALNTNSQMADDTNYDYFLNMFDLRNAINGGGFDITFEANGEKMFHKPGGVNSERKWNISSTLDNLSTYIYSKLLSIKTNDSNNIKDIDCLGFTSSQIVSIKNMILNDIIGTDNVEYDSVAFENIINNMTSQIGQGAFVFTNDSIVEGQTIFSGSAEFMTALDTYLNTREDNSDAEDVFKNSPEYQSYKNMFDYKAYEVVVDKIVDEALCSREYDAENNLVDADQNPLYFLYPRLGVVILPGIYLGGNLGLSEDEIEDLENGNYDDILDKFGSSSDYENLALEKFLPSWKILSVVYKPEDVYGINNVTDERIDGIIITDLEITFAGQDGYSSVIESSVQYVSDGEQVFGKDVSLQDRLYGDACPDINDQSYGDSHYLSLVDLSKVDSSKINDYVIGAYDGFDFSSEASKENSTLIIERQEADNNAYYSNVKGLPYRSSFAQYTENADGLFLDLSSCLGHNYIKVDIDFLEIKDDKDNSDVTDTLKRTDLNILIIEPHAAN